MLSSLKKTLPQPIINFYHLLKAMLAAWWYGFPSREMIVIGITGTNGKTTSCNMVARILEEDGHKVGMATTINFQIGRKKWVNESKMTTLSAWQTQSLLARMKKAKCRYAVIEVSSHAIDQNRIWGIDFDIVGITNITREHLDYHKTMEEYQTIKEKLFGNLSKNFKKKKIKRIFAINLQDKSWRNIIHFKSDKKYAFSLTGQSKIKLSKFPNTIFIHAGDIDLNQSGSTFTVNTPHHSRKMKLNLPGKFNIQNALLATCVARSQKVKLKTIKDALAGIDLIPGRMERIDLGQPYQVYIDYALTPDSLEKIYRDTIKPIATKKIIAVFGACGDRDQGKRPIMSEIVSQYADKIVLTHEDSWTEDPDQILKQLEEGLLKNNQKINRDYFIIKNRKEAIHKALTLAKKDDIVVITGKGAETVMVYPDRKVDWNERRVVEELIGEIK